MKIFRFNKSANKKVLLHYKSDPFKFLQKLKPEFHTNNQEIRIIVKSAIENGFGVDLIDRRERNWLPKDEYELFISNASGNSGQYYSEIIEECSSAKKYLYALGPHPKVSNSLVEDRYNEFKIRTGLKPNKMLRFFDRIDTSKYNLFNEIICMDNNGFSSSTYRDLALPIKIIRPTSSGNLDDKFIQKNFNQKKHKLNNFLVFSGHGFIAKGIDVITESFLRNKNATLDIVGPFDKDIDFYDAYYKAIIKSPNINLHGYLNVYSKKFENLCLNSQWVIQASAAEGCSTSLVNASLRGLVPISTFSDGFDNGEMGILLRNSKEYLFHDINNIIDRCSSYDLKEYEEIRAKIKFEISKFSKINFKNWWLEFFNKTI